MLTEEKLARLKRILAEEKRFIDLLKRDSSIVSRKLQEKDIDKILLMVDEQEMIDEGELVLEEDEMREEEREIDLEEAIIAKKGETKLEDAEIADEIHHLKLLYVLIPLIKEKNENLRLQKQLLAGERANITLFDLPVLIRKEKEILDKVKVYEKESEEVLEDLERQMIEEKLLKKPYQKRVKK